MELGVWGCGISIGLRQFGFAYCSTKALVYEGAASTERFSYSIAGESYLNPVFVGLGAAGAGEMAASRVFGGVDLSNSIYHGGHISVAAKHPTAFVGQSFALSQLLNAVGRYVVGGFSLSVTVARQLGGDTLDLVLSRTYLSPV